MYRYLLQQNKDKDKELTKTSFFTAPSTLSEITIKRNNTWWYSSIDINTRIIINVIMVKANFIWVLFISQWGPVSSFTRPLTVTVDLKPSALYNLKEDVNAKITWSPSNNRNIKTNNKTKVETIKPPNRDEMIARAAVLRQSILKQQIELQKLERQISCCSATSSQLPPDSILDQALDQPVEIIFRTAEQAKETFLYSFDVLKRKLNRVKTKTGKDNKKYKSEVEYLTEQTKTGVRIVKGLVESPNSLMHLADPSTPTLIAHLPAIYARLDKLEIHV